VPATRSHRRRLALAAASLALTVLTAAALVVAAALVPAPPAVLPLHVPVCIGAPIAGAFELSSALAAVNEPRAELRRELDQLPETPHPLGY
jgi:hypothetical protein